MSVNELMFIFPAVTHHVTFQHNELLKLNICYSYLHSAGNI